MTLLSSAAICRCGNCFTVQEYSKKLVTVPEVHPDMELVEQPAVVHAPCTCERSYTAAVR